jgi:hypothetical protein
MRLAQTFLPYSRTTFSDDREPPTYSLARQLAAKISVQLHREGTIQ